MADAMTLTVEQIAEIEQYYTAPWTPSTPPLSHDNIRALCALARASLSRTEVQGVEVAELEIRKRQVGLLANCLSHIQGSPIAPEPIRVAATAAIVGASELTKEIAAPPPPAPALEPRHDG
jgi:hypothetical protein